MANCIEAPFHQQSHKTSSNYLSKTYQSSVLMSPSNAQRITISPELYSRYCSSRETSPSTSWGRKTSYGGMGRVQQPEVPLKVQLQKGHIHYGSGKSIIPRNATEQNYYKSTRDSKSLKNTGETIPCPTKINIGEHVLSSHYPMENTYFSHKSKNNLFPSFEIPDRNASLTPEFCVVEKTRGGGKRHEVVRLCSNSSSVKKLENYPRMQQKHNINHQNNYPAGNSLMKSPSNSPPSLSHTTREALAEIKASQWRTTYDKDYDIIATKQLIKRSGERQLSPTLNLQESHTPRLIENSNIDENTTERNLKCCESIKQQTTSPVYKYKDINTLQGEWSPTEMHRRFHMTYKDLVPSLKRVPDVRITPQEKRHHIPEADGMGSYIFNGQYVPMQP